MITKRKILRDIKSKAYANYMIWVVSKDIKHYDKSLLYLELYCEYANKSYVEERAKMWKDYEEFNKETSNG